MTKIIDISSALQTFEESALKHANANEIGDYKTGNKNLEKVIKAVSFLKEHNELLQLSKFLNHKSIGVRMTAATYLLPLNEDTCIKILTDISNRDDIHSLVAETTLSEWKKGNFKL